MCGRNLGVERFCLEYWALEMGLLACVKGWLRLDILWIDRVLDLFCQIFSIVDNNDIAILRTMFEGTVFFFIFFMLRIFAFSQINALVEKPRAISHVFQAPCQFYVTWYTFFEKPIKEQDSSHRAMYNCTCQTTRLQNNPDRHPPTCPSEKGDFLPPMLYLYTFLFSFSSIQNYPARLHLSFLTDQTSCCGRRESRPRAAPFRAPRASATESRCSRGGCP